MSSEIVDIIQYVEQEKEKILAKISPMLVEYIMLKKKCKQMGMRLFGPNHNTPEKGESMIAISDQIDKLEDEIYLTIRGYEA